MAVSPLISIMNQVYDKLINYYGKDNISEEDATEVQNIIIESGSLEYANNMMNKLFKEDIIEIE